MSAAAFAHFQGNTAATATPKAKAEQVCPEGKELGSPLVASVSNPSSTTQGRARLISGLMVRLVIRKPSSIPTPADAPARRVARKQTSTMAAAMKSNPAFPKLV